MQQYNSTAFDPVQFLNEAQDYAANSNDHQPQFDPALFDIPGDLGSFQRPQQHPQSYNQPTRHQGTQSPALSQFKQNQDPYSK